MASRSYPHLSMGNEDRAVRSLKAFKARMCDCGNPICFGSLTSLDVTWLVGVAESYKSLVQAKRRAAKDDA